MRLNYIDNVDCLEGLKEIPDGSVDLIVTDPPYFLSMGHAGSSTNAAQTKSVALNSNPKVMDHLLEMNRARTGVPKTEVHRQKIANSQPRRRRIINLDTGEVFDSVREAASSVKGAHPNIVKACAGERRTAYGYHWEYIDREEAPA